MGNECGFCGGAEELVFGEQSHCARCFGVGAECKSEMMKGLQERIVTQHLVSERLYQVDEFIRTHFLTGLREPKVADMEAISGVLGEVIRQLRDKDG